MNYQCEIVERPPQTTLSVRSRIPMQELPQFFAQAYTAIIQYLEELEQQPAGPPYAVYHNIDVQNLDVEAGFLVSRPFAGRGDIRAGQLPGGQAASCVHTGPYDQIAPAYEALVQYIQALGRTASGIAYEIYLNDPKQTLPHQLQTQIVLPLIVE